MRWYEEQVLRYNLSMETIAPMVRGRDLLALGMMPGPEMGGLLQRLYEAQLDGVFTDLDTGVRLAQTWLGEGANGDGDNQRG